MAVLIEIWSDVACPWCYIGKRRFEAALERFAHRDEVDLVWRSFQLDPTLPEHYDGTELDYLSTRKGMPRDRVTQMFEHVTEQAAGVGLHYDFAHVVVANSFLAHRFLHLAKDAGVADAVKEQLLSAHFEHAADIGDIDVLVAIGAEVGLAETTVRTGLEGDRYSDDVRADIDEGEALGIRGVPFFVIDRAIGLSGAQPTEAFASALAQGWAAAHPLTMLADADGQTCGIDGCD
ncbi:MAG: disulfide bond formation protein DsbA [Ilumatobacteraceae bacterium]|nr:disulfide bond formation protein DsbA [Ilumatobacteraceae bacterium]